MQGSGDLRFKGQGFRYVPSEVGVTTASPIPHLIFVLYGQKLKIAIKWHCQS